MEAVSTRLQLHVPPRVTLVSGHSARDKIVELAGIELQEIERRLASAAEKEPRA